MAEHDVDALIVTKDGKPVGIFSERDYARKVNLRGRSSTETLLEEVISPVSCIAPNDSVDSCLHLMTSARIRHLVAIDNGRVSGLVSIADLVNWMITAQAETIDLLSDYIALAYRQ
jgi:CBS domain-containing protein